MFMMSGRNGTSDRKSGQVRGIRSNQDDGVRVGRTGADVDLVGLQIGDGCRVNCPLLGDSLGTGLRVMDRHIAGRFAGPLRHGNLDAERTTEFHHSQD